MYHFYHSHLSIRLFAVLLLIATTATPRLSAQCFNMQSLNASGTVCHVANHEYQYDEYSPGLTTSWYGWNWTSNRIEDYGLTGYNSSYKVNNILCTRHTVVKTQGNDYLQSSLKMIPSNASTSIRLGNPRAGGKGNQQLSPSPYSTWHPQAEAISFEFTVTAENPIILFNYAALLDQANHYLTGDNKNAQPRIVVKVTDTRDSVLKSPYKTTFEHWGNSQLSSKGGWKSFYRDSYHLTYWKDWSITGFDLSPFIGRTVRFRIENYECNLSSSTTRNFRYCGEHFGYLYFNLGCTKKEIEKECLANHQVKLTAPEGFTYRWYKSNATSTTLGTDQTIIVEADGKNAYCCELSHKDGLNYKTTLSILADCPIETHITRIICDGEYFSFAGKKLTEAGKYEQVTRLPSGQDSTTYLTLIVQKTTTAPVEKAFFCEGSDYEWVGHGKKFAHLNKAGTYRDTLRYYNSHCDSVRCELVLGSQSVIHTTDKRDVCENALGGGGTGFWWNGIWINSKSQNGEKYTTPSMAGCDSTVTLSMNITDTIKTNDTIIKRDGFEPFKWNNCRTITSFADSGKTCELYTEAGCDSVVTLVLIRTEAIDSTELIIKCDNELPFLWHGLTIQSEADDGKKYTLKKKNGQDSIYFTLSLRVFPTTSAHILTTVCAGTPFMLGDTVITTSGSYHRVIPNHLGCDSTIDLDIRVVEPTNMDIERVDLCEGNTYTWEEHGEKHKNLAKSGEYHDTIRTKQGCDSIYYTLQLYIHPHTAATIKAEVCKGDTIHFYGTDITKAGQYKQTIENKMGCDSIITLEVEETSAKVTDVLAETCTNALPYLWREKEYYETGDYYDTIKSEKACDSIMHLQLIVRETISTTDTRTMCANEPFDWNGLKITAPSDNGKQVTLSSITGCDSVVTLALTVYPAYPTDSNIVDTDTICHDRLPYTWEGHIFSEAGEYTQNLKTKAHQCDSIVRFVLVVNDIYAQIDTVQQCISALPFIWNGIEIKDMTDNGKQVTLTTIHGCDSVVTLALFVVDTIRTTQEITIMPSQLPFQWGDSIFYTSGTKTQRYLSQAGCDSLSTLSVIVQDTKFFLTDTTVCENTLPYIWSTYRRLSIDKEGVYRDTVRSQWGVDSVYYELNLQVRDNVGNVSVAMDSLLCGDTLVLGLWYGKGQVVAYQVDFSEEAQKQGFVAFHGDSIRAESDTAFIIPMPHLVAQKPYTRPEQYALTLTLTDHCEQTFTSTHTFIVPYPAWFILQRWNDVLTIRDTIHPEGYFSQVRWYHEGTPIEARGTAGGYCHVQPQLAIGERYWAELTRQEDGKTFPTCEYIAVNHVQHTLLETGERIELYEDNGNPRRVIVETNTDGSYTVYDVSGRTIQQGYFGEAHHNYTIPLNHATADGTYLIRFETQSGKIFIKKWCIQ